MNTRPRTEGDLIENALGLASSDPDMAEIALEIFCDAVDRGDVPDRKLLNYLADCLRRIIAGEKPLKALNLTGRSRGQRRLRTLERIDGERLGLALAVVRYMKSGITRNDAIEQVVSEHGASTATVKRAYRRCGYAARVLTTSRN
jgi:hypothetical protein